MVSDIKLKVYNKENKINIVIQESYAFKIITIHKYDGDIEYKHSFTTIDTTKTHRGDIITYYDYTKTIAGIVKENLRIANNLQEHEEKFGDGEIIKTTTSLISGNVYEDRIKKIEDECYETRFTNGKLYEFCFNFKKNKINEYLKILNNGKRKN